MSAKQQFTRGPLHAKRNAVFKGRNCIALADEEVIHPAEAAANARLWAAATDLYDAALPFKAAPTYFDIPDDTIVMSDAANNLFITAGDIRALKAALAKAEDRE